MKAVTLMLISLAVAVAVVARGASAKSVERSDEVLSLPGLSNKLNFRHYAGYIPVSKHDDHRQLFYWLAESQGNPSSDPLVIWLNGGPGCSSMEGFLAELGPFRPKTDGKTVEMNAYSWNRVSNLLAIESPAGVGFSYSTNTSEYTVGDARTSEDLVTFLVRFLEKYPQFRHSDVWITGESYGGHYVPNFAQALLRYNDALSAATQDQEIRLKGFMAGNPWTDAPSDNSGAAFMWWSHALNSDETYHKIDQYCDFANIGPMAEATAGAAVAAGADPIKCNEALAASTRELGNVNIYNLFIDVCLPSSARSNGRALVSHLARAGSPLHAALHAATPAGPAVDPCMDDHLNEYMNRPDVQTAIHARPGKWSGCSSVVDYSRKDLLTSMLPVYKELIADGRLKIVVYSGDVDGIVPVTGTRRWLAKLNLNVVESWRPWTAEDKQVGGYVVMYEGLLFATVRQAGHQVPEYRPLRAFDMFSRALSGRL